MEHRFDDLAKSLARGATRREAFRLLGVGLGAGLLSFLGIGGGVAHAGMCDPSLPDCDGNTNCFCLPQRRGGNFCSCSASCAELPRCRSTRQCPTGWKCARTCSMQRGKVCNPPCNSGPPCVTTAGAGGGARSGRP